MTSVYKKLVSEINQLPNPTELQLRAKFYGAIDHALAEANSLSSIVGYNIAYNHFFDRYYWEDGGGQEANIIFKADRENEDAVLLYAYDHESAFNTYGEDTYQVAFEGIPISFQHLLEDEKLKWEWDSEPEKVVYATVAVWWDNKNQAWKTGSKFLEQVKEYNDDGGFAYAFSRFLEKPTVEKTTKFYIESGLSEADLPNISDYYAKYYKSGS